MGHSLSFNSYSDDPYQKLSNFWPVKFIYKGSAYNSAEHAYQAAKCILPDEAVKIKAAPTAKDAKKIGRSIHLRKDWDKVKFDIMKEILRCKFYQNLSLRNILLKTGQSILIHKAPWDDLWGDGKDGNGQNVLGRQLMEIRQEFVDQINRYTSVLERK